LRRSLWAVELLALIIAALSVAAAAGDGYDSAVEAAKAKLSAARADLVRAKAEKDTTHQSQLKAEADYNTALAEYKDKVSAKNVADTALQSANELVRSRSLAASSQATALKSSQAVVDDQLRELPEKESYKAKLQRSLTTVETFPSPIVPASKEELLQFRNSLDDWYALAEKNKAQLAGAEAQLKSLQASIDSAKEDQVTKSAAASVAQQQTGQAKAKADLLHKIQLDAQAAAKKASNSVVAAHRAVVNAIKGVRTALLNKTTAMEEEVKDSEAATAANDQARIISDKVSESKSQKLKLTGQMNEAEAQLKVSESELLKAEAELNNAQSTLDAASRRTKVAFSRLHEAQNEAVRFQNPLPS